MTSKRDSRGLAGVGRSAMVKHWRAARALLALFALAVACGNSHGEGGYTVGTSSGGAGSGGTTGSSGGFVVGDGGLSGLLPTGDASTAVQGDLSLSPANPVVNVVTGTAPPTVQFNLAVSGAPTNASSWLIDRGELGKIDSKGLFTPSGTVAGVGNVSASYGGSTVTTSITINIQTIDYGDPGYSSSPTTPGPGGYGGVGGDGPGAPPSGGASGSQVSTLNGTPTADQSVSLLYPYDGTVWPQALLAPLFQWNPGSHSFDSVYIHLKETNFEYKGYFAANKTPFVNVPIPQAAWTALGYSNGGEAVSVTLVFGQGGTAYGPYTESWKIAQGSLQGTIYYNSYGTSFVLNSDTVDAYGNQYGAGTLAIAPGAAAPTLVAGVASVSASGDGTGCRVCHTASADGTTLVTQASNSDASSYAPSEYLSLTNDTTGGAGAPLATQNLAFPALYRDGSLLFSNAAVMNGEASADLIPGDGTSKLYSLPSGSVVSGVTGLPTSFAAGLPSFSPDGQHVSFNFYGGTLASGAAGDQVSLGIIDFDGKQTFSNARVVYTPPGATPGGDPAVIYSSFLPSSAAIVFEQELSNGGDTEDWGYTWNGGESPTATGHTSELWWLDVATNMSHRLDQLNGYASGGGSVYLPSGMSHTSSQDATVNYEPTVTPISSGGYAWIVFTSRRMYGNVATLPPWESDPTQYRWHDPGNVTPKKLWVAAIDLNAAPGTDASHPAFYLPGQELYAGNSRGYWTVPPCKQDGSSCTVGDECCGGFCQTGDAGSLVCTAQKPSCAQQYEKCTQTSDCCGASSGNIECINSVCSIPGPPK